MTREHTAQAVWFGLAALNVRDAITELQTLRDAYRSSRRIPAEVKVARMAALTAKIDQLGAVFLDGTALPWCEDVL